MVGHNRLPSPVASLEYGLFPVTDHSLRVSSGELHKETTRVLEVVHYMHRGDDSVGEVAAA